MKTTTFSFVIALLVLHCRVCPAQDLESRIKALEETLTAQQRTIESQQLLIRELKEEMEKGSRFVSVPAAGDPKEARGPSEAASSDRQAPGAAGAVATGSKVFNPDISVVGDFVGTAGKGSLDASPALEMREAEVAFQAAVDPYARADFFFTFGPDEVGLEEGYVTFLTLPAGLLVKAGKFRDAFGKVNGMHAHVLPWADRPLVTRNLLGGEDGLADAGVSVARLFPNRFAFLEVTGQLYRGESSVFKAEKRSDVAGVLHLRGYRDLNENTNLELGGSFAAGHNGLGPGLLTELFGVDATFRWRPLRRAIYQRFLARTELAWSRTELPHDTARAFGAYAFAEYQLTRRWVAGIRADYAERAEDPTLSDRGGSLVLTYWPSEFSQIRGQFRHTRLGEGGTADELLLQVQFSIGAHGAHTF
jgi:hypothetical protein